MFESQSTVVPLPLICGECNTLLPITVSQAPDAGSVQCAFCGSRYRGAVWTVVPAHLVGNVLITSLGTK